MNHEKWFLFARIEDCIPKAIDLQTFYAQASIVLGRKVDDLKGFMEECKYHRLHGNYEDLIHDFVRHTSVDVIDEMVEKEPYVGKSFWKTFIRTFCRKATPFDWQFDQCTDDPKNAKNNHGLVGRIPSMDTIFVWNMMKGRADLLPTPQHNTLRAYMLICKRMGFCSGLRHAMAMQLIGFETERLLAFHMISKNTNLISIFHTHKSSKKHIRLNIDSIIRDCATESVKRGYFDDEVYAGIMLPLLKMPKLDDDLKMWLVRRRSVKSFSKYATKNRPVLKFTDDQWIELTK